MSKQPALTVLVTFATFLAIGSHPLEDSYAQMKNEPYKRMSVASTIPNNSKQTTNSTVYTIYWLSLLSVLALPFLLRLLKFNTDEEIEEDTETSSNDSLGIKGGLSISEPEKSEEEDDL